MPFFSQLRTKESFRTKSTRQNKARVPEKNGKPNECHSPRTVFDSFQ
jgi:hypothetical protein